MRKYSIEGCLRLSANCPLCRKSIDGSQTGRLCTRIYLSTESDDNPSECLQLKKSLATTKIVIDDFQEQLAIAENNLIVARRDYNDLLQSTNEKKYDMENLKQELAQVKTGYLEELHLKSEYIGKVIDLTSSNKTLTNELEDLKKKNTSLEKDLKFQQEKNSQILKKHNYENDYFSLKRSFNDLVVKQDILQSKFIDLSIAGTPKEDEIKSHIQNLEKQLVDSKTKETKSLADIKKMSKKNQNVINDKKRIIDEKQKLEKKFSMINEYATKLKEYKKNWVNENRNLHEQLKTARENLSKLQQFKENWIAENRSLHEKLKSSKENIRNLHDTQKKTMAEKKALQTKLDIALRHSLQSVQHNRTSTQGSLTAARSSIIPVVNFDSYDENYF